MKHAVLSRSYARSPALLVILVAANVEAADDGSSGVGNSATEANSSVGGGAEPKKPVSLDVGVGLASAYVWRGYNVFQDSKQMDQNSMVAPSVELELPEAGWTLGYWSAFQLNGENRAALQRAGVGAEQDLYVLWELPVGESLATTFGLTYYFYPFAEKNSAETSWPSYIEPSVGLTYNAAVQLGLTVSYFHGIQEEIKGSRHTYFHPALSKTIELSDVVGMEPAVGFGYKLFNDSRNEDNIYDITVDVDVPVAATDSFTLTPSVHGAWTNLTDNVMFADTDKRGFGDEYVVWGGLEVGYSVL